MILGPNFKLLWLYAHANLYLTPDPSSFHVIESCVYSSMRITYHIYKMYGVLILLLSANIKLGIHMHIWLWYTKISVNLNHI